MSECAANGEQCCFISGDKKKKCKPNGYYMEISDISENLHDDE